MYCLKYLNIIKDSCFVSKMCRNHRNKFGTHKNAKENLSVSSSLHLQIYVPQK